MFSNKPAQTMSLWDAWPKDPPPPVTKIILHMHTPARTSQCWSRQTPAWTRRVHLDAPGQRHGQQPVSGTADPGVVKQDKSSGGSGDTTKTRPGPQRVRMSSGERPIGAAKGKQSDTEALCQAPPPQSTRLPSLCATTPRAQLCVFPVPLCVVRAPAWHLVRTMRARVFVAGVFCLLLRLCACVDSREGVHFDTGIGAAYHWATLDSSHVAWSCRGVRAPYWHCPCAVYVRGAGFPATCCALLAAVVVVRRLAGTGWRSVGGWWV